MRDSLQNAMQVGIVHFMAYPECLKGEGPVYETLRRIVEDDFFSAVEVTTVKDPAERRRVISLLAASHMAVGYGAQPALLFQQLDLNAFDGGERKRAIDQVKACAEDAAELGAKALAVLSGPEPGERREEAIRLLIQSLREIAAYAKGKGLRLLLESFDQTVDKKRLIGPHRDALMVSKALRKEFPDFGIMVDLSHLPLQEESPRRAFTTLKRPHIGHIHIGNCVKQAGHPLYGDQHPRFGVPGGENDVREVVAFLRELFAVGYLGRGRRPIVAFEVKPTAGESSEVVIANAKRTLREAWASL